MLTHAMRLVVGMLAAAAIFGVGICIGTLVLALGPIVGPLGFMMPAVLIASYMFGREILNWVDLRSRLSPSSREETK